MTREQTKVDGASRSSSRDRALLKSLIGGAGLQLSIALSTLVSLPFVTRSLTTAEFGVFATLTGLGALMALADLGIGGALTSRLAEMQGREDDEAARVVVSTAVVASCLAGGLVWLAMSASRWIVPWQDLLGAHGLGSSQVNSAVMAMAFATGLSVPAVIGQRILYGIERGGVANLWLLGGAMVTGAMLIVGSAANVSLYVLLLMALGIPAVSGIASGVSAVVHLAPQLRPRLEDASATEWRRMLGPSGWYFAIALSAAVSFQADALIVSSVLGAATAGVYALAARAFGLVSASLTPALLQLWPAFGDAFVRRDRDWIRSRLLWSTAIGIGASAAAGLVIVAVGPPVVRTLFTEALVPDRSLLVALTCWTTYSFVTAPAYLLLNATGRVRVHGVVAIGVAALNLPLSIVLTHVIGISGPVWGSLLASVAVTAIPGLVAVRHVLDELEVPAT
jgi:O-antigen/teichoic acid export membrane protein